MIIRGGYAPAANASVRDWHIGDIARSQIEVRFRSASPKSRPFELKMC
jgi:hypothetical protein